MEQAYIKYYLSQTGHGLNEIGPLLRLTPTYQRGRGIGDVFASLFRFLKPALSSGLNLLKDEAIKTGANILSDITSGSNFKQSVQNQTKSGLKNLRKSAVNQLQAMYGGNIKKQKSSIKRKSNRISDIVAKRKKSSKVSTKKKYRTLDIFN